MSPAPDRTLAASGLSSGASSSAATARTTSSNSAIWAGKTSRNRPEMRRVTSIRGRFRIASGRMSKPATRLESASHRGLHAEQGEGLREIVAAGAHRGTAPDVEHDPARPFAVVLGVAGQHRLGGAPADLPRGSRRHGARIDAVEVAPGRQHIGPPAAGRARRAGRDEAAVQGGEQPAHFRLGTGRSQSCVQRLINSVRRLSEHMQPIADPHVLDVAQPGIELDQCRLRILVGRNAGLGGEAGLAGLRHDQLRQAGWRGAGQATAPRRIRRTSASSSAVAPWVPAAVSGGVR